MSAANAGEADHVVACEPAIRSRAVLLIAGWDDDSLSYDGAAMDATRTSRPTRAEAAFDWRLGTFRYPMRRAPTSKFGS